MFLHSHFSRSLLAFSAQILLFSGNYRCLYPDFRGHGRTKCDSLAWNSRMIADDMAGFLDAMGIASAHLFGYSCGAYVGCYMAAKCPEKVRSLVTIGCPVFFINGEQDPFGTCTELREKVPSAKVCKVRGAGHRPHFVGEQAKELNPMILNFYRDVSMQKKLN